MKFVQPQKSKLYKTDAIAMKPKEIDGSKQAPKFKQQLSLRAKEAEQIKKSRRRTPTLE